MIWSDDSNCLVVVGSLIPLGSLQGPSVPVGESKMEKKAKRETIDDNNLGVRR